MKRRSSNSASTRIQHRSLFIVLAVVLASCGGGAGQKEEGDSHGEESHGEGSTVTVTPTQFTAIEGLLGHVEQKDLTTALKATGFLKLPPQNIADSNAALGGNVG